jgi:hypothetical protein
MFLCPKMQNALYGILWDSMGFYGMSMGKPINALKNAIISYSYTKLLKLLV